MHDLVHVFGGYDLYFNFCHRDLAYKSLDRLLAFSIIFAVLLKLDNTSSIGDSGAYQ